MYAELPVAPAWPASNRTGALGMEARAGRLAGQMGIRRHVPPRLAEDPPGAGGMPAGG